MPRKVGEGNEAVMLEKHYRCIEILKQRPMTTFGLSKEIGIGWGSVINILDTITLTDPRLCEDDDGTLSYMENGL